MTFPKRTDGSPLTFYPHPDGRIFIDCPFSRLEKIPRHECAFKDYGLLEHERCSKCGLIRVRKDIAPIIDEEEERRADMISEYLAEIAKLCKGD
jgi:hypothetical protein